MKLSPALCVVLLTKGVCIKRKPNIAEWHKKHLENAEIIARDVRIKLSHTNRTDLAAVIGKSKFYGLFALTKDNVRYVHRSKGTDILQYTWY